MTTATQLLLPLDRRSVSVDVRVKLSDTDKAYRQNCIDKGVEFTPSFLKDSRAQRLGCSVRDLDCMLNYELNRELADEAVVMRLPTWATDRASYIDWEMINKRAAEQSRELAVDMQAFREWRQSQLPVESTKKSRGKK